MARTGLTTAVVLAAVGLVLVAAPGRIPTATDLWLVPALDHRVGQSLADAVEDLNAGRASRALPVFVRAMSDPVIGAYARIDAGRADLALGRPVAAAEAARAVLSTSPTGSLAEAALELAADAATATGASSDAVRSLEAALALKPLDPERIYLALGRAALGAGNRALAIDAWQTVYYTYPLTDESDDAAGLLKELSASALVPTAATADRDLSRAEQLYGAKRFTDARRLLVAVRPAVSAEAQPLIDLRVAECDAGLHHTLSASEALKRLMDQPGAHQVEARYAYLGTVRDLGRHDEYVALAHAFVDANPGDPFAEAALFDLSSFFTRNDDDASAAATAADLYARFPHGAHADRAAWRAGWWAFRTADYATTVRTFDSAAVTFPHADLRPAWLYWSARAHQRLGDLDETAAGYRHVVADYRNTYYGREAQAAIEGLHAPMSVLPSSGPALTVVAVLSPGQEPANAALIQALLSSGLYEDAANELRLAERDHGPSPLLDATLAFALNQMGQLRPGITAMRRAYPQFMAAGGEALPPDLLAVIFPVAYWDLIEKYAGEHQLDPGLVAALIAQESTFDAGVKSSADAWGLMQVLPSTGREYARKLGIRPFRTSKLTDPETNIRIGTAFFADLVHQFGDVAQALAAYNAGEDRVSHWTAARPGLDRDEFVDDIPYAETQNYVKRILGAAEDYRQLYVSGRATPLTVRRHAGQE